MLTNEPSNTSSSAELTDEERQQVNDHLLNLLARSQRIGRVESVCHRLQKLLDEAENVESGNAAEEILDTVEQLQTSEMYEDALIFFRNGGVTTVERGFDFPSNEVKSAFADLVAEFTQNNLDVQNYLLKNSTFLTDFCKMVENRDFDTVFRAKLLLALSAIVRNNEDCQSSFYNDLQGIKFLRTTFDSAILSKEFKVSNRTAIVTFHLLKDASAAGAANEPELQALIDAMIVEMRHDIVNFANTLEYIVSH